LVSASAMPPTPDYCSSWPASSLRAMWLRIRWCILAVHEVCGVLVYLWCAFIIGSPEGGSNAILNLVLFTALSLLTVLGKRNLEFNERIAFLSFVDEKTRRFQTEFKLSQLEAKAPHEPDEKRSESVPDTTYTGKIFDDALEDQLEGVMDIGRSEHWLIQCEDLELQPDRILGRGGFGVVILGTFEGIPVAVKTTLSSQGQRKNHDILSLCNEVRFLRKFRHPNIVSFYGLCFCAQHDELALVLEYVHGKPLKAFVLSQTNLPSEVRMKLVHEIARALRYLHSRSPKIIHGDLKDSNIFVENASILPQAKLLDFGLSRALTKHAKPLGGTINWLVPEILSEPRQPPRTASDVFAFGHVMRFVLTGIRPSTPSVNSARWPDDRKDTQQYETVVEACTQVQPSSRPCMETVCLLVSQDAEEQEARRVPHVCDVVMQVRNAQLSQEGLRSNQLHETCEGVPDEEVCRPGSAAIMLHPRFQPTPVSTQARMLLADMLHWNFKVQRRDSCCLFHAAVQQLSSVKQKLEKMSCRGTWCVEDPCGQCSICKALAFDDSRSSLHDALPTCMLCGEPVQTTIATAKTSL